MIRTVDQKINIVNEDERVQIEPYEKHVVRIRVFAGEIQNLAWTLLPPEDSESKIRKEENNTVLVNGDILVRVTKAGKNPFCYTIL